MKRNLQESESHYSLDFEYFDDETVIKFQLSSPHATTVSLPHAKGHLKEHLPSIFESKCFNDLDLPFYQEVNDTEIAHLFEHMLLVNLYEKKRKYYSYAKYDGVTKWNASYPNLFKIFINAGRKESAVFELALQKSIDLLNDLLQRKTDSSPSVCLAGNREII